MRRRGNDIRVAFLVKTLPIKPWIEDQRLELQAHGIEVLTYAKERERTDAPLGWTKAETPGARLLGEAGAAGSGVVAVLADAARAMARHPFDVAALATRWRPGSGSLSTRIALAATVDHVDLLHAHFGNYAASILPARRLARLPLVVSFYGWDASAAPLAHPGLYERLFRECEAVTALSHNMVENLAALGCPREKLSIIRLAVDPDRLRREAQAAGARSAAVAGDGKVRVLGVGRLVEKKGFADALDALALAREGGLSFIFRIVGEGPLRADLEKRAQSLGIAGDVVFTGSQVRGEVVREMASCDVFLLPSRTASTGDQEGTPTVLIEAGALGVPCVSTLHAGIPEVVINEETGLLTAEGNATGIASALLRLGGDRNLRARLGTAARRHIDAEFSIATQAARLEAVYRACLDRP